MDPILSPSNAAPEAVASATDSGIVTDPGQHRQPTEAVARQRSYEPVGVQGDTSHHKSRPGSQAAG